MNKQINLQDTFLNILRKEHSEVTIILTNGYQQKGVIKGYDNFVLMLDSDGKQMMIYKHAISTIVPARPVSLSAMREQQEQE